jgi:hypothetical protein
MGCKELWIGCHVSCKEKALIMEKDQDSQQIFVIFWLGRGGGEVRVMIILTSFINMVALEFTVVGYDFIYI